MCKMKKCIYICIAIIIAFGLVFSLTSCGEKAEKEKINVVCTIFPEYDWVKEIVGDEISNIDLTLLLDNGADLHNFQPTVADISKISKCDLFIYVGGESDEWADNAIKDASNKNMQVINLLDVLGNKAKVEEEKEGMQGETEHEHENEGEEEEEKELDEHVWLSLKNAQIFVSEISNKLAAIDKDNKEKYLANAKLYNDKLVSLDNDYANAVNQGNIKTLLFGDRFPFRYLVDDYGLDYYAAFVGCSAEAEAKFETITFLAGKVDELGLHTILKIESSDGKIANTIKENTKDKNQQILTLDSLQSTTIKSNVTYIDVMQSNLEVLKKAIK